MNKLVIAQFLILFIFTSCGTENASSTNSTYQPPPPNTKIENIKIKKTYPNAWGITGMVRNTSSSPLKGAVKIKFINSKGDIVHSNRAFVNDGDPLKIGQAGYFEYFTKPENFTDVIDFDIEFYER